ncbi:hypothetical protein [Mesorhizobium sp. A556]
MLDVEKETASTIIDALAVAIDNKPSSAKTFSSVPYESLAVYGNWGKTTMIPRTTRTGRARC